MEADGEVPLLNFLITPVLLPATGDLPRLVAARLLLAMLDGECALAPASPAGIPNGLDVEGRALDIGFFV